MNHFLVEDVIFLFMVTPCIDTRIVIKLLLLLVLGRKLTFLLFLSVQL